MDPGNACLLFLIGWRHDKSSIPHGVAIAEANSEGLTGYRSRLRSGTLRMDVQVRLTRITGITHPRESLPSRDWLAIGNINATPLQVSE
jgi:hypothetical protein